MGIPAAVNALLVSCTNAMWSASGAFTRIQTTGEKEVQKHAVPQAYASAAMAQRMTEIRRDAGAGKASHAAQRLVSVTTCHRLPDLPKHSTTAASTRSQSFLVLQSTSTCPKQTLNSFVYKCWAIKCVAALMIPAWLLRCKQAAMAAQRKALCIMSPSNFMIT